MQRQKLVLQFKPLCASAAPFSFHLQSDILWKRPVETSSCQRGNKAFSYEAYEGDHVLLAMRERAALVGALAFSESLPSKPKFHRRTCSQKLRHGCLPPPKTRPCTCGSCEDRAWPLLGATSCVCWNTPKVQCWILETDDLCNTHQSLQSLPQPALTKMSFITPCLSHLMRISGLSVPNRQNCAPCILGSWQLAHSQPGTSFSRKQTNASCTICLN